MTPSLRNAASHARWFLRRRALITLNLAKGAARGAWLLTATPFGGSLTPKFPAFVFASKEAAHGSSHGSFAPHAALGRYRVRGQLHHPHGAAVSPQRLPAAPGRGQASCRPETSRLDAGSLSFPFLHP